MCTYIKIRLKCKISIITIIKLIKTISNYAIIFFYISSCIAGSSNIEYIHFNLSEIFFITSFINFNICYILMAIKVSNFLYNI